MTDHISTLEVSISPLVLNELIDSLEDTAADKDFAMRQLIQEIITNAKIFVERFKDSYFLNAEPIHDFVGLQLRDGETSLLQDEVHFRLIHSAHGIGIFSPDELKIDEMYAVRLLIAESQMPEFTNDTFVQGNS